jgi:hypothetical protein
VENRPAFAGLGSGAFFIPDRHADHRRGSGRITETQHEHFKLWLLPFSKGLLSFFL